MSAIDMNNLVVLQGQQNTEYLGRIVFYRLGNAMVPHDTFGDLRAHCGLTSSSVTRTTAAGAFSSATTAIKKTVVVDGQKCLVYCRPNQQHSKTVSRELILERPHTKTNEYSKLANFTFHKSDGSLSCDDVDYLAPVDVYEIFKEVENLYQLNKTCVNRHQINYVLENLLAGMQAVRIQSQGSMYFVPRAYISQLSLFEDLVEAISHAVITDAAVAVNSLPVDDCEKQRSKMAEEFYAATRQEIKEYAKHIGNLITNGCQSSRLMGVWLNKIAHLEAKRREYETLFQQNLDEVEQDMRELRGLGQELSYRIKGAQLRPCA